MTRVRSRGVSAEMRALAVGAVGGAVGDAVEDADRSGRAAATFEGLGPVAWDRGSWQG